MRKRYAIMLAVTALVVGVVTFQAVTAEPPEPYVRLSGPPAPLPLPVAYECHYGAFYAIVQTDTGQREKRYTGQSC